MCHKFIDAGLITIEKVTIRCWARVKSDVSGPGSDNAVGTHRDTRWELAERIRGLPGVRQKLTEGIGSLPGIRQKLVEDIESLLGVRWELAQGDQELARMTSEVRRKKTKKLVGRSSEVAEKLVGS